MFKYIPSAFKVTSLIITCLCVYLMLSLDIGLSVLRILCCFLLQPTGLQFSSWGKEECTAL